MSKLKLKDYLFVIITPVLCFIVGLLGEKLFENGEFFAQSLLSRFGFKPLAAIIVAILCIGIVVIKEFVADKNYDPTAGTSTIKYIISMAVAFIVSVAINEIVLDKIDAEGTDVMVLIICMVLKYVFDRITDVKDYTFLSVGYIALFFANCLLAIFISLCYTISAIGILVGVVIVCGMLFGGSSSTRRVKAAYNDGYYDAQSGVSPRTYSGDYYRGYQDGSR